MAEEYKKARKARKSALTREISNLRKFMVEDEYEEIKERIPGLKQKFKAFEEAHDRYHSTLDDETVQDESDKYYDEVCSNYIEHFTIIKTGIAEFDKKEAKVEVKKEELSQCELMSMMNLPKVEIRKYNGDPLTYHAFFALFDEHVHKTRIDPTSKLSRLLQYTDGDAYKAIAPCAGMGSEGYDEARAILKKRFGSDLLISDHVIKSVKEGKPVRTPKDLQDLADELNTCKTILTKMGRMREIDTQTSIIEIVNRVQPYLRNRWKRKAMEFKREKEAYPDFADFVAFISSEAEEATDPVYGAVGAVNMTQHSSKSKPAVSSSFVSDVQPQRNVYPCVACHQHHRLFACETFKGMKPLDRLQLVKKHKLCENCLLNNHSTEQCRKPSICSVPNCGMKHNKFIHIDQSSSSSQLQDSSQLNVHSCPVDVVVPIVKVDVNNAIVTNALLDNASTASFCSERLFKALNLKGTVVNYTLNTMSSRQECKQGLVVNFHLKSCNDEQVMYMSNVYVVPEIPVNAPKLTLGGYPHLADLSIDVHGPVDILIGQSHAEALIPLETRRGNTGDPFAVKTLFGWSINGPVSVTGPASKQIVSHFIATSIVDSDFHNSWNTDSENLHCEKQSCSVEDKCVDKKYLPHQAVTTEMKPDTCCILFDCASKFKAESLNDKAFQGPDYMNRMLDVPLQFRQHEFAIVAEVKAKHNQVIFPVHDHDTLKFLWQETSGGLQQYRNMLNFFVDNDIGKLISSINCNSFHDDCLQSVATAAEVVQNVTDTPVSLAKVGFEFVMNSDHVLSHRSVDDHAKEVKECNPDSKSKLLGINCDVVSKDQFYYDAVVKCYDVTQCEMFCIVASLCDPPGLFDSSVVHGRMLFQDATQMQLAWDDVPPDLSCKGKSTRADTYIQLYWYDIGITHHVFSAIFQDCKLKDEISKTHAKLIVNGHQIPKLRDHVEDLSPFESDHLLSLKGSPISTPGNCSKRDMYHHRWKEMQYKPDQFWKSTHLNFKGNQSRPW
jgi:hypothetical protein